MEFIENIPNKSIIENVKLFTDKIEKYQISFENYSETMTIDNIIIAITKILPYISQTNEESIIFIVEFFSVNINKL